MSAEEEAVLTERLMAWLAEQADRDGVRVAEREELLFAAQEEE